MYEHIVQAVQSLPWAILPEKLAIIREILVLRANGERLTADEIRAELEAANAVRGERQVVSGGSAVAVIPIVGTLIPRGNMLMEMSGAVSVQRVAVAFQAALADPEVGSILLDVDSPGGQVGGIEELANEIYQARGQKQIVAVANTLAASAAYWLASAAGELVVTPSGEVGSIGVFAIHEDVSAALDKLGVKVSLIAAGKYKTEGNPFEPLGEEALTAIQSRVNEYYDMFTRAVARGRGVSQADVIAGFGEGRVVGAETAVRLGMADRVGTIDQVLSGMIAENTKGKAIRADEVDDSDFRRRRARALGMFPGITYVSNEQIPEDLKREFQVKLSISVYLKTNKLKGKNAGGMILCPICDKGSLIFSAVGQYNQRIQALCSTPGCVDMDYSRFR